MSKMKTPSFAALQHSYKLQPPQQHWALSTQFKIGHHPPEDWSEEVSSNPFVKTKQLFKNKHDSVLEDDLTNEYIFSGEKQEGEDKLEEFNSFGIPQPHSSSQEVNLWNSSSMEINFEKAHREELELPHPTQEDLLCGNRMGSDSSIREFCFKLNQTNDLSLEKTPVKKWS